MKKKKRNQTKPIIAIFTLVVLIGSWFVFTDTNTRSTDTSTNNTPPNTIDTTPTLSLASGIKYDQFGHLDATQQEGSDDYNRTWIIPSERDIAIAAHEWDLYLKDELTFDTVEEKHDFLFENFRVRAHGDFVGTLQQIDQPDDFDGKLWAGIGVRKVTEVTGQHQFVRELHENGEISDLVYALYSTKRSFIQNVLLDRLNEEELKFEFERILLKGKFGSGAKVSIANFYAVNLYNKFRYRPNILSEVSETLFTADFPQDVHSGRELNTPEYRAHSSQLISIFLNEIEQSGDYDSQQELDELKDYYSQFINN